MKIWIKRLSVVVLATGVLAPAQANERAVVAEAFTPEMEWFKDGPVKST